MKKIIFTFLLLLLLSFVSYVNAESCDTNDIKRLKEIADGVEITYEWLGKHEDFSGVTANGYSINISGLIEDIYIYNYTDNYFYYNKDKIDGVVTTEVNSGTKKFYIRSTKCGIKLKELKIKLPIYNTYSLDENCKNVSKEEVQFCDEWYQGEIKDYNEFLKTIEDYNEKSRQKKSILTIIKNNQIIILASIVTIILIIILIIKNRKRGRLE